MVDYFFDVASHICNNVDIMNLEVLQYSSKAFLFLDKKTKGFHSMWFKNQNSNFFQIFQDSFQIKGVQPILISKN